jgi:hypothetical protein
MVPSGADRAGERRTEISQIRQATSTLLMINGQLAVRRRCLRLAIVFHPPVDVTRISCSLAGGPISVTALAVSQLHIQGGVFLFLCRLFLPGSGGSVTGSSSVFPQDDLDFTLNLPAISGLLLLIMRKTCPDVNCLFMLLAFCHEQPGLLVVGIFQDQFSRMLRANDLSSSGCECFVAVIGVHGCFLNLGSKDFASTDATRSVNRNSAAKIARRSLPAVRQVRMLDG